MCGEVNRCAGGVDTRCNCDMNDEVLRTDGGHLIDKRQLPITEVCAGYDENQPGTERFIQIEAKEFVCRPEQISKTGLVLQCQLCYTVNLEHKWLSLIR